MNLCSISHHQWQVSSPIISHAPFSGGFGKEIGPNCLRNAREMNELAASPPNLGIWEQIEIKSVNLWVMNADPDAEVKMHSKRVSSFTRKHLRAQKCHTSQELVFLIRSLASHLLQNKFCSIIFSTWRRTYIGCNIYESRIEQAEH